jgi:hypothetical protein
MGAGRIGDGSAAEAARRAAEEMARRAAEAARQAAEAAARQAAESSRRAAPQGQSSFESAAPKNAVQLDGQAAPASSLFTENTKDGSVNCLDKAADWVSKSSPALRGRSELVFLADSRAGAEGQTGHVVVRQGERVLDPSSGKSYDNMQAYLKEQPQYREAGSMSGTAAAKVFATEPGSPERARALADAKVSPELQRMMVADPGVPGQAPNAATAKPFSVEVPGQSTPVSVELSASLDKEVEKKDGFTTVKLTAEAEVSASGSVDLKKVSVGAGVSTGTSQTYEVKMTDADFERLKRGEIPPPHPLKPETVPDKCSVTMESSQFKGRSAEASVEALQVELGLGEAQKSGKGMSIQTERDGDKVQVTAGPTELFESEVSFSVGVKDASVTLTGSDSMSHYKLRTAEFDLGTDEGRAAYSKFASSGEMPFQDGAGVSGAAKIEKIDLSAKSELEAALGPFKKSLTVTPESNASVVETTFPDGSKENLIEFNKSDGTELQFTRHTNAKGEEDYSKQEFSMFLKGMEGGAEEVYANAFKVDQHQFDKNNDVYLSFTPEQLTQLSERARFFVDTQMKRTGGSWSPGGKEDALIQELSKATNPADVANALTLYSGERTVMGEALSRLTMTPSGSAAIPGSIEARDRNA